MIKLINQLTEDQEVEVEVEGEWCGGTLVRVFDFDARFQLHDGRVVDVPTGCNQIRIML